MGDTKRLSEQISFIVEMDKLKSIVRRTVLIDGSRNENDAEHSWHLAIMALVLAEYARDNIDMLRVIKMVLLHDIVEIDAGDTFCYDDERGHASAEREQQAAERIFNVLPVEQAQEFRMIWDEFESRQTPEAKFAAALDRLHPLLHNYYTHGYAWKQHGIARGQVLEKNNIIADGSRILWDYAQALIEDSVQRGFLKE